EIALAAYQPDERRIRKMTHRDPDVEKWLAIRKEAGKHIDPQTAEVACWYAETLDPYGVDPDLPDDCSCIGRQYFARAPGSDIWVRFGDLPEATREAIWKRNDNGESDNGLSVIAATEIEDDSADCIPF